MKQTVCFCTHTEFHSSSLFVWYNHHEERDYIE